MSPQATIIHVFETPPGSSLSERIGAPSRIRHLPLATRRHHIETVQMSSPQECQSADSLRVRRLFRGVGRVEPYRGKNRSPRLMNPATRWGEPVVRLDMRQPGDEHPDHQRLIVTLCFRCGALTNTSIRTGDGADDANAGVDDQRDARDMGPLSSPMGAGSVESKPSGSVVSPRGNWIPKLRQT